MQIIAQYGDMGPKWFNVSLRVLIILAKNSELTTSKTLSEKTNTESSFIRKVLAKLVDVQLIDVKEGRYGGYSLNKPASEINVSELYLILSKDNYLKSQELLIFHSDIKISTMIQSAENAFVRELEKYTITDLL